MARCPTEERQTKYDDDDEVDQHTEQGWTHCVGGGKGSGVFQEPGAPRRHVLLDGLHLEERAEDRTHVEELMAVACRGRSCV